MKKWILLAALLLVGSTVAWGVGVGQARNSSSLSLDSAAVETAVDTSCGACCADDEQTVAVETAEACGACPTATVGATVSATSCCEVEVAVSAEKSAAGCCAAEQPSQ